RRLWPYDHCSTRRKHEGDITDRRAAVHGAQRVAGGASHGGRGRTWHLELADRGRRRGSADARPGLPRAAGGRRHRPGRPGPASPDLTVLVGVDQGTSGTRAVAFDTRLRPLAESYRPALVRHPQPGWIEKDAAETVAGVEAVLHDLAGRLDRPIAAVGLDNEGETVVAWDAETLQPLAPAVVWGCRRSQPIVERLSAAGHGDRIERLSGLPLDPYFSATKIRWLVENDAAVQRAAGDGRLRIGTLDAHICARLGDGARTEPSTAGRTQLLDLTSPGEWSGELLALHDVDPAWLPRIGRSVGDLGSI